MAKTAAKTKTKAKGAVKKSPAKRGRKPVDKYPHVFDMRRPCADPAAELALGKAFYDEGKTPSPNVGVMSATALKTASVAFKSAFDAGDDVPSMPLMYSFIRRGIAGKRNATCVITGHKKKGAKPKAAHNIPKNLTANWGDGDRVHVDLKTGDPATLRCHHKPDARDLVVDRAENVLSIGKWNYVVGTTDTPAAFLINGSKTGGYGASISAGKREAFAGQLPILASLVGRFINEWATVTLDDGTDPGGQLSVGPNMLIDAWGYFERAGKRMTPAQIRKSVADGDIKGMSFKAVYTPDGEQLQSKTALNRSTFWAVVKPQLKSAGTKRGDGDETTTAYDRLAARKSRSGDEPKTPQQSSWENFSEVQTRTRLSEMHPFGGFSLQTGIIPVSHYGDDHKVLLVSFFLGAWVGAIHTENSRQAHYRLHPEEYESPGDPQPETEAAPVTEGKSKKTKAKTESKAKAEPAKAKTEPAKTEAAESVAS